MNEHDLPKGDPRRRPSQWVLVLIALGVAAVTSVLAGGLLYLIEVFKARPLG